MEYDKILEYANDDTVKLALDFKNQVGKTLNMAMTEYQCINGTLSDGFECLRDEDRYFQAHREMWSNANAIENYKATAMEAQADLMDAEDLLKEAVSNKSASGQLRAQAKIVRAKNLLTTSLFGVEECTRCLRAFNKVRLSLKDKVDAMYPLGVEQAEAGKWKAVTEYRALKKKFGYPQEMTQLPMDAQSKAELGLKLNTPELVAWLAVTDQKKLDQIAHKVEDEIKQVQHQKSN